MQHDGGITPAMKAALYVDFDNIYSNLLLISNEAATLFATQPYRWLSWFESGSHAGTGGTMTPRKLIVRNCYLNPAQYSSFRVYFVRSGFSVVDCPPLTSRNKNSADIYMALSINDLLSHATHFDEFIILSADADFTPVVLRLRAHDRRTTILANEVAASAYKSACDFVVEQNEFIEDALGIGADDSSKERSEEVAYIDKDYTRIVALLSGDIRAAIANAGSLAPREIVEMCKRYPEFTGSNWFGHFSLKRLAQEVVKINPGVIDIVADEEDDWELVYTAPEIAQPMSEVGQPRVDDVLQYARDIVKGSESPVTLSQLGMKLIGKFGERLQASGWCGAGSLSSLIAGDRSGEIQIHRVRQGPGPVYAYSPVLHKLEDIEVTGARESTYLSNWSDVSEEIKVLVERVARVTDVPPLPPHLYALLFHFVVETAENGVRNMNELSKMVRDRLVAVGHKVGRNSVNYVLAGLRHENFDVLGRSSEGTGVIRKAWLEHVIDLCKVRGLEISEEEKETMGRWLCADIDLEAYKSPLQAERADRAG